MVEVFAYPHCGSTGVVKNGKNLAGSKQFLCRDCGKSAVMHPQRQRSEAEQEQMLAAYRERPSLREIAWLVHESRNDVKGLLKKK